MQVKQRLRINSVVSAMAVLVIFVVLFLTIYRVSKAVEASKIADAIMTASFERLILRTDSNRTCYERSTVQLIAKHKQVGDLLKAALGKFPDPEDKKTVSELLIIHESIGKFSKTIRENREKRGPNDRPDALSIQLEDRLLSQLNMRVYETILFDSKLQESGNKAVSSALMLAAVGILFVLLLVSAMTLINSWTMGRSITDRIRRLRDSAAVIGSGDLDHLIDIKGDDEFTGLSEEFNAMTAKLRDSYHELETEIKERKRAEEELRKAHDELELRIQERTRELREANESLEQRVSERTAELQTANASLRDSRLAALNMMEDAVVARRQAEEVSLELHRAHDELELRISERTKELATTVETLLGEMAERERAEGNLQRLNRLYAVLSETDQAIVRATDKESLFRDFCRISVEQGGFILSWVGLVDEESGAVNIVAANGATDYLDDIRITAKGEPTGEGPTGISIREGTYFICNDFLSATCTTPWHEKGLAHGICASASVALKEEGLVIGALTLYSGVKDSFDQQHVDLLRQMGADISFALDNFTRENRRRKTEQALRDETLERLRAVEALREKEQLLLQQSRLAAMGEMINNIAHQWRQPLNVLGLNIQRTMLFYELGDFNGEFLQTSTEDAMKLIRHMSQTIDDFRNFFKPDKEKTCFSVNQAIQWTISLLKDGLNSDHIEIVTQNNGDPHINGYFNEFCQVLLNIVLNARDVIVERKIAAGTVTIVSTVENNRTVVTITDNGGGVPEEIIDRVFEPYFSTKGVQGTGIGLFMSKNIIETNMTGSITVRNTAQGAEFRIEI